MDTESQIPPAAAVPLESVPAAGVLLGHRTLRGTVVFRTGHRDKAPRSRKERRVLFIPHEGFDVLRAKIINMLKAKEFTRDVELLEDGQVFFKAAKNARQADFKPLSSANFWQLLQDRWACLTAHAATALVKNGGNVYDVFEFEFFVYLAPPPKPMTTMRRAIASRVREAADVVAALQQERGIAFGPIEAHHLAVHHARQPDGTALTIPDGNTTRQARALDDAMRDLDAAVSEEDTSDVREVDVQLFGSWVSVPIRLSSLRRALGFPQHDIFTQGIFHGVVPQTIELAGEGVPDTDHIENDMPSEA